MDLAGKVPERDVQRRHADTGAPPGDVLDVPVDSLALQSVLSNEIVGEGRRAHLILPASDPELPWTAMVVLAFSTGPWYFCTNQYINQNSLGAKTEWHARMGILLACFLGFFTALAYVFPGMVAHAINPNLASGDEALPFLLKTIIPSRKATKKYLEGKNEKKTN